MENLILENNELLATKLVNIPFVFDIVYNLHWR